MLQQLISVAGAGLVLPAYALAQTGRLRPADITYGLTNFLGATLLTWVAVVDRCASFILLESAWAVLSLLPLLRRTGHPMAPAVRARPYDQS